jgi:phage gp36-like protein
MPDYATLTDLGNLGLTKEALKKFPIEKQTAQLTAASRFVDSYLGNRYLLPLTSWGDDLKRATAIVAAYDLMSSGAGWNPIDGSADQHLYLRYKDVLKWLEGVPTNKVTPTNITDSSPVAGDDGMIPIVASDDPRGW